MENKKLMDEVIKDYLEIAKSEETDEETKSKAVDKAVKLMDRAIELEKLEAAKDEKRENLELEKAKVARIQEEQKKNNTVRYIVEVGVPVALFIGNFIVNNHFLKKVSNFEKDYTFTTTPAKNIVSNLFKFRK
jgi:hypothetical protein